MGVKAKIVASASHLLIDFGVRGVTMDEVAANLGMSKRTLYEHFKDKKELIAACVEHMTVEQECSEEHILEGSETVIDELFLLFSHMDEDFNKRGKLAFEIKKYYPDIYEKIYIDHYSASYARMKSWLEKGIQQGLILADLDIDLTVYVMMETINNLALRPERVIATNLSLIESFKYVIVYFFRGISTNKGVELIDTLIRKEKKH